ncbi:MAG: type secretion protein ImpA [Myxococcaceae bacterium]|nr:type secretion protein ImpA [Myxococcaceae bacterium]
MVVVAQRQVFLHSPAGEGALFVHHLSGQEELGRCFEFVLSLYSEDHNIAMEKLLGQHATVELGIVGAPPRYFDGIVSEFSHEGSSATHAVYRMVLRPWLWLLTCNSECRVAEQDRTSIELIEERFKARGFADFVWNLSRTYTPRKYCVQYRESDFAFISRLLEEEGIYYYFTHALGEHKLVLTDSNASHHPVDGHEVVRFARVEDADKRKGVFSEWRVSKRVTAGQLTLTDYDFEKPKADLAARSASPKPYPHGDSEFFDYPGGYHAVDEGEYRARVRLEELGSGYEVADGSTDSTALAAGALFELKDHPRQDQNRQYLIVSAHHELDAGWGRSGEGGGGTRFSSRVQLIDHKVQFRPRRSTPWPKISGAQTATVVGPPGQEMWTDKYGRVRVQFHWDREHSFDLASSCWIRVAHAWAGSGWGTIQTPRIGQEVVVEFMEGNPDQPLITGSVYNDKNKPPYQLPAKQAQSGIKTQSTIGGSLSEFNELRFDDSKGHEELGLRAQRNRTTLVKNNHTATIGHDHTHTVKHDLKLTVDEGIFATTVSEGKMTTEVPKAEASLHALTIKQTADEQVSMEVGGCKIVINQQGIVLSAQGSTIMLNAAGIVINGALVNLNPPGFVPPP